jgi:PKD repeat protein
MKRTIVKLMTILIIISLCLPAFIMEPVSAEENGIVQTAVIGEEHGYLNLSTRGGRPSGGGVDGDGAPPLQQASMTATFDDFELNGIPFDDWQACRATGSVDDCLATLGSSLREQHPGDIGGDTFEFDVTITNTSAPGGPVLTTFAFQSKFSESPALGSRIGDKLFSASCEVEDPEDDPTCTIETDGLHPLGGVKKNGTTNGLFGGKIKGICINSSDDYPSDLNLGVENETLECTGGRTFNRDTNWPQLQAADGTLIDEGNVKLPKGLLPGESMTMRLLLDAGTDDGALQRAYAASCDDIENPDDRDLCRSAVGPLIGNLANLGETIEADNAAACLELDVQEGDNVLDVVNFGDVKIIRDSFGNCVPSFEPFSKNQFLTVPRRNWGFTDILDTRDDYTPPDGLSNELPTVLTGEDGKFSFLDFGDLRSGEMNFFEILRGFGEFGETLDPSCGPGGSQEGKCGGEAYVPWAEFYAISGGKLIRQEVVGAYGDAAYDEPTGPHLTATIDTGGATSCSRGGRPDAGGGSSVRCKTTDPFETPGQPNPGTAIGAGALATFSDVEVISDDKTTIANEGGQAGGDLVRFTVDIENTSPPGSNIYLTSFNFQTKQRGLTDINVLDGTSIQGRQDLRTGADGTLPVCSSAGDPDFDPFEAECFDAALGIGRFPNVLGNSLLSSTFVDDPSVDGPVPGKLEAIKKNGTFQPLMKTDFGVGNFICIKSGAPSDDQDADETCSGEPGQGLAPGESQSVRLEMDYGDFRGLILRVAPGTLADYGPADAPFGLLEQGGDFDCGDQRRLPYCHPDLANSTDPLLKRWFTSPESLEEVEFVTVHQPGDAASVMDFERNFGKLLAMAGFTPTAEFYQGSTQMQVGGAYLDLPGSEPVQTLNVVIASPLEAALVNGTVEVTATTSGTVQAVQVEFFVNDASLGTDTDGSDGWSILWDTEADDDGVYELTAVAVGGTLTATSGVRTVTVANDLSVQIVEPADRSTLTGVTTLVAETAGLVPATGVSFAYSGDPEPIGAAEETAPGVWELAWDTSDVVAGDYQLTATATNDADPVETATATIDVEIVALSVTLVAPDDGAFLSGTVELQAEVVSAAEVDRVEFLYDPDEWPDPSVANPTPLGTATLDAESGLWVLDWDTTSVGDTPLTKPRTEDELSVVVTANGGTADDTIQVRVGNMLTSRIFLPDNQEDLRGYEDLEAFVASEYEITSVRFDLYPIDAIDPEILKPFGEASPDGQRILDHKYGRPLGDPTYPTGSPAHPIGEAFSEGSSRWVIRDWDTKAVPDGTYGLVATATDAGGRRATYMVETYIVNDLEVEISAPTDGAQVRGFVALEARTRGLFPATEVSFDVAGMSIVATETAPGRWKAVWDARMVPAGAYAIAATASNLAAEEVSDTVDVELLTSGGDLQAFFPFDWSNCTLTTCDFLDASVGGPTSWLWEFGDGAASAAQNPTHTYSAPGVYTVTLTVNGSSSYSRTIPVGNIGIDGFNTNPIDDAGTETITWTSALKDFAYEVGDTIYVPVLWSATTGPTAFSSLPDTVLFTPEEADGTDPQLVGVADDGILFAMSFTEVQYRGDTGVFKGKVNLGIEVLADSGDGDPDLDWTARLGTNVDVTNSSLVDTGDVLNAWVVDPTAGETVGGTVEVRAGLETTVPVSKVEFFAGADKIGEDVTGADGWAVDWDTTQGTNGEVDLTAVATGGGLAATSTAVRVTVNNTGQPPPTVTLTAAPDAIASGGNSTLTWSSTNATACEASGGWTGERQAAEGSEQVSPPETTTYTLTCTGDGGSAQASATVTVVPAPTVTLSAEPQSIVVGDSSTLTWSTTNADTCQALGGWSGERPAAGGSESTGTLTATTVYTLTCTGVGGTTGASVTVTVDEAPTGITFTGSSASGARGTWSATISVTGGPPNTTISGAWNIGGTPNSCTTDDSGACSFTRTGIRNNVQSATWTYPTTDQTVTRCGRPLYYFKQT